MIRNLLIVQPYMLNIKLWDQKCPPNKNEANVNFLYFLFHLINYY